MKTSKLLIVIATISLILTPFSLHASRGIRVEPISPTGERVTGNQWLFVIGIDTYIEWSRLETAVNDAKSVKNVLLSRYHFNSDHLIELYDEDATRANILYKLRWLAQNIVEDDSLFIFYAGHGHLDPITKSGSWIPVESGTKDVSAWISNNDIKNYLRTDAIKAKHILLVSDSCFSGDFFRGHRGKLLEVTDAVIKKAYTLSSRQAITSGGLEPVSDAGFGNNSVFSHFLVKTLEENKDPFLVPSVLFSSIRTGVAENAEQFPQFGSLKDTGGQQGGELVLFLKQDARLQDLSDITNKKLKKIERLQQMELEAKEARRKEAEEISKREKDLAELDAKIEAMKNRLGTSAVSTDDSLDNMLAMVKQKEVQKKRLDELRRQKEDDERKRNDEIAELRKEREDKIITALIPEVEKYKKIISSEFGKSMRSTAWQSLIAKCPLGWADGVDEGNTQSLLWTPDERPLRLKELETLRIQTEKLKEGQKARERLEAAIGKEIGSDGRFIAHGTGVVFDNNTGLEWIAGPDRDTNWDEARSWVNNLTVAGGGWRMPTIKELSTLHRNVYRTSFRPTLLLKGTGLWVWSGEIWGAGMVLGYNFREGREEACRTPKGTYEKVLAVRARR
ncbi:MAG: caspase family protein [Desulfobacteraceae bacterium]|nr:caspase family protein [Desulfobacteraceae bacterium]